MFSQTKTGSFTSQKPLVVIFSLTIQAYVYLIEGWIFILLILGHKN